MKKSMFFASLFVVLMTAGMVFANSAPQVSDVSVSRRTDGSGVMDINYTLSDADGDRCTVSVQVSNDGGSSWTITPTALSGDMTNVYPCRGHIIWNSKTDLPGAFGTNYRVKVTADDNYGPGGMVWVSISEAGFNGQMSKYETTNAQYCQYLNAAKASGDIIVSGSYVVGASGAYSGQNYYRLDGSGFTYNGATSGGAARINWTGSSFTVDSGFENHPVTYVSWYGSTAFASYYGWRLPTEWEWQAVADYNGSYIYGCGTTINNSMANYYGSTHPDGTTIVGSFGTYGYGVADMSGNVWEWTSTISSSSRVLRGGCWYYYDYNCAVSVRGYGSPYVMNGNCGFRVCR